MSVLGECIKRNCKLFFKDKGMVVSALITPLILLGLYGAFLANVYKDTFISQLPEGMSFSDELLNGIIGGQLMASLIATASVSIAFICNLLMVQDKVNGVNKDFQFTPVCRSTLALGYFISSVITTMLICVVAITACLIYLACTGWYLSISDIGLIFAGTFLLVLIGVALSSIINYFLSTQGQISAVGTIISAGYGFVCGAYMPIASFSESLRNIISFTPGIYGTSLLKHATIRGVFEEMTSIGLPSVITDGMKDGIDFNVYFSGNLVEINTILIILSVVAVGLILIYVILSKIRSK